MSFIRLNTAFTPPKEVSEKAIELSNTVSNSVDTYFVLDGIQFYPHITIYPPEYPEENIPKVLEAMSEISKSFNPINLKYQKLDIVQRSLIVVFERSSQIQEVHEQTVNGLNPLREGHIRDKYSNGRMKFSHQQLQNIEKYGYPAAMSLDDPHLTITRLKDENEAKEILSTIKWDIPEFIIDKIGVYKSGEYGTCRELLREFSFLR